jgi:hypothetical protein
MHLMVRLLLISLLALGASADGNGNAWGRINSKDDAVNTALVELLVWSDDVSSDQRLLPSA